MAASCCSKRWAFISRGAGVAAQRVPSPDVRRARPGNPLAFLSASDPDESAVDAGEGHTTHFSVIDRFGNVVSFTTTLRDSFGSGIMVQPYGFVLNNTLSLFNIPRRADTTANDAGPNKRPMGNQTPTVIVKNGEPFAATGTYGAEFSSGGRCRRPPERSSRDRRRVGSPR